MKLDINFNRVQTIQIDASRNQQRLDNFLIAILHSIPKSKIYKIIRKGEVRVNSKRAKPEYKLNCGDLIRIPPLAVPEKVVAVPSKFILNSIKESIFLDEKDFLILDKPSGIAVHGGSGLKWGIINALRYCCKNYDFLELIHRLDKETSGCLLIAKSSIFLKECQKAWQENRVIKKYQCLVKGHWPQNLEKIAFSLKKNVLKSQERVVQVSELDGKESITYFRPLEYFGNATLLEAQLETGRTHQIRVHAAATGHPIAGDTKYGENDFNKNMKALGLNRLFLHANKLVLPEELYSKKTISINLPAELLFVIKKII